MTVLLTTYSPPSTSSVQRRRSLQQNTVRDATQHGNTLQRRRQCGEGGVLRFHAKATLFSCELWKSRRKQQRLHKARHNPLCKANKKAEKRNSFYREREKSASRRFHRPLRRGSMARHTTCFMRTHFMMTVLCSTTADFPPSRHRLRAMRPTAASAFRRRKAPRFRHEGTAVLSHVV